MEWNQYFLLKQKKKTEARTSRRYFSDRIRPAIMLGKKTLA